MPWAVFTTKAQWTTFHDAACADLGIPRPGRRQSDGTIQTRSQWTEAAFAPTVLDVVVNGTPRKIGVCFVPPVAITRYGLNTITDPVNNNTDDGTWTVTYLGTQYVVAPGSDEVVFPFRKAKPAQWTDPATGVTYDTATGSS